VIWSKNYGSSLADGSAAFHVPCPALVETADHGFLIGSSYTDPLTSVIKAFLIKSNAPGTSGCHETSVTMSAISTTLSAMSFNPVATLRTATSILTGTVNLGESPNATLCFAGEVENILANNKIEIAPNPANGYCTIKLSENTPQLNVKIYNAFGQTVFDEYYKTINDQITIDISHLYPGIYFLQTLSLNDRAVKKRIIY
jgi:hypothetical protein